MVLSGSERCRELLIIHLNHDTINGEWLVVAACLHLLNHVKQLVMVSGRHHLSIQTIGEVMEVGQLQRLAVTVIA